MVLCLDQIELADQLLLETFEELIATDELPNTLFVFTANLDLSFQMTPSRFYRQHSVQRTDDKSGLTFIHARRDHSIH